MDTVYKTQPGTIPHRAINHLKSLPPGSKLCTAELAEAIEAQTNGFSTCMRPAREAGMVHTSYHPQQKNIMYWHLHDDAAMRKMIVTVATPKAVAPATPAPPAAPAVPAQPAVVAKVKAVDKVKQVAPAPEPTETPAQVAPAKAPGCAAADRHFRAGLFTDKSMLLEVGADRIELHPHEVEAIKQLTWNRP